MSAPGFVVVFRLNDGTFRSPRYPDQARGYSPAEVWVFGKPASKDERLLYLAVAPVFSFTPAAMVHFIGEQNPQQTGK